MTVHFEITLPKTPYSHHISIGLARATYYVRCIYSIIGRKITKCIIIYNVYIYGSGQPYIFMVLADPIYLRFWLTLYIFIVLARPSCNAYYCLRSYFLLSLVLCCTRVGQKRVYIYRI